MFRFTRKSSSGIHRQYLAKITHLVQSGYVGVESRFSAPVQTGPEAHPASYTMGTRSFPGVKRPGRGVEHPPTSRTEVNERVELNLYSSSGHFRPVLGLSLPVHLHLDSKLKHEVFRT